MTPILIIVVAVVIASSVTLYLRRRGTGAMEDHKPLPPLSARGLFEAEEEVLESPKPIPQLREQLLRRAAGGDVEALADAWRRGQTEVYREVLDALRERTDGNSDEMQKLVTYISKSSELRTNPRFARRVLDDWKADPARRSVSDMLHAAALSDDAGVYLAAVESLVESWSAGKLPRLSNENLIGLVESQYWVLASEARQGGAGFALREKLAGIRRELAARVPAR
jgi:hypothetical protein